MSKRSCPKCGSEMLHKPAKEGLAERHVCTNCGHDEVVKPNVAIEGNEGRRKQTLID